VGGLGGRFNRGGMRGNHRGHEAGRGCDRLADDGLLLVAGGFVHHHGEDLGGCFLDVVE
jgi:hypothetical protein